jgi:geranylgeranyl diphosphate synthase type I
VVNPSSTGVPGYAAWAAHCFETHIARRLIDLPDHGIALAPAWRATCAPGAVAAARGRLFPGALFLLWVEALGGEQKGAEPLAAAIEVLHNATLVHDDVIDGHALRRGQTTLLGQHGLAGAVLGGDGLQADALELLAALAPGALRRCLPCLGQALRDVALGQWLDEPSVWADVVPAERLAHWHRICTLKLAIGNVGAPLAAWWLGADGWRSEPAALAARLSALMADFSVVSQIINDLGDWFDFAGLHTLSTSGRKRFEESMRKPTLPTLWVDAENVDPLHLTAVDTALHDRLLQRGRAEISARRLRALASLHALALPFPVPPALHDYFAAPNLPPHTARR